MGCDTTFLSTLKGMPDLAIDLRLPNAREAPESLVHSSQYPFGVGMIWAGLPLIEKEIGSEPVVVVRS